ncbi:type II toxin-antitoxin system death-on-curing family toxin [Pseudomonas putida]|uniref:type II toxin-antitoxin system death-on-curing family toxin n=1 Tax=Pseudomonas putida TaxID=303 RepID=UPI002363AB5C|nr:type II toxin-antitoxin system death-on-curing family toxin [Pseudomonas putida]MDD1966157.1 type II toxin-antitoxin system death-on-curing family toxin [Pseudomonas putida]
MSDVLLRSINWLSETDIASLNNNLIDAQTPSEPIGVLSLSGLSSAQSRAIQYQHYTSANDIFILGAVFSEALVQNHPFFNANKRTAAAAVMVFLLINGMMLKAPWEQVVDMFEGLAKHVYDIDDFTCWLKHWSVKFDVSKLDELAEEAYNNNKTLKDKFHKT